MDFNHSCIPQSQVNWFLSDTIWAPIARKPVFGVCEQQRADQPAYPRRQIRAFVICFLESITSKQATREISIL